MIAYEDLVAALTSWRARNGLPTTPPDYGEPTPMVGAEAQAVPADVYDLSDDSGLIMAEDLAADPGGIETAMEISAEEHARGDDYADSPGTDAYYPEADGGAYGEAAGYDGGAYGEAGGYDAGGYDAGDGAYAEVGDDAVQEEVADAGAAYDEAPAGGYDAGGYEESADFGEATAIADDAYGDAYGDADAAPLDEVPAPYEGTVDADPVDVIEEEAVYADAESMGDATVVAADPSEVAEEPDELPPIGDDDDRY